MKISELAWLSVKRAVGDMGQSISYDEFCSQAKRQDAYLSNSIDRVFSDINAFFGRLVQLEKIPARIEGFDLKGKKGEELRIPFSSLLFKPNVIKAVFQFTDSGDYVNLPWSVFQNSIKLKYVKYDDRDVYVQYRLSMPSFRYEEILPLKKGESDSDVIDDNIDLYEKYGIMEEAMPLCIDFVDSLQNRDSDASLANNLMIQTESRMNGLNTHETLYLPNKVRSVFRL